MKRSEYQLLIVRNHGKHATHIVSIMRRGREAGRRRRPRVGGMRGGRHSRTRHPRLDSRRGGSVLHGWWSITHSNASARPICEIRLPWECG